MMFCRDEGEGEAVLLVHGLGASSRVFDPAFSSRRAGRRLIAIDLPRTARSRHWAPSEPAVIGDELVRVLGERGVSQFRLFGHSFGGLVALAIATRHAERVLELTVASAPALGLPGQLKLMLDNPFADLTVRVFGTLPLWRPVLKTYMQFIWGEPRALAGHHLAIYEDALNAEGFNEGVLEALRAIARFRLDPLAFSSARFPRHVLWGDKDPLVPVIQGEHLAAAIGADFRVFQNVGHCLPEERPEAVEEAVSG